MYKIKLFTDSTCDLTKELITKNDISVVPLYVGFGEDTYKDGEEIDTINLYKKVDEFGALPKTSAPSPADFYNAFKVYVEDDYNIIYIGLSSKLSSTIQNAKLAALEFEEGKVQVIDSLNLSTGIGLLLLRAVDYIKSGLGVNEIIKNLEESVPKVRTAFVIDTLEYLYKGGRCTALQSFIGSVLKIKPVVKVMDGKLILAQKLRGKRDRILNTMLEGVLGVKDNISPERITVTHALSESDAQYLKKRLEESLQIKEVLITNAGSVIASHCGPNTVGILYIEK